MNNSKEEVLDVRDLQKWNCIIEPTVSYNKSYGGLYLGDIDCAQDPYLLQQLNIGAMLSVIDEPQVVLPEYMNYLVRETIAIPDCETESLISYFPRCSAFLEQHRQYTNVMVHCFAGISRSASVVLAYLMEKFDWPYERTLSTIKAVRKQVKPNQGFANQLKQYESYLNKKRMEVTKRPVSQQPLGRSKVQSAQKAREITPTQRMSHNERRVRTDSLINKTYGQAELQSLFQTEDSKRLTYTPQKYPSNRDFSSAQQNFGQYPSTKENHKSPNQLPGQSDNKYDRPKSGDAVDLSTLEMEIMRRKKSLAELQKKYLEVLAYNESVNQSSANQSSLYKSKERVPTTIMQQPLNVFNHTQPIIKTSFTNFYQPAKPLNYTYQNYYYNLK